MTSLRVPFFDLTAQYRVIRPELRESLDRVLAKGQFILGDEVEAFEAEFAAKCGVRFAVGVNSGTTALMIGLWALGVRPGDEVVTVSHTFVATAEAIACIGATPVFVDVEEARGTMDPAALAAAIGLRTRAIVPVHLYGHPAEMDAIRAVARAEGIPVLEDACQAHGALYRGQPAGSLSEAACFSFYPSKNLGACGEAGAIVTNDGDVAEQARILRDHGSRVKYQHSVIGMNGRMEAIQGAVLRVKLRYLDAWNSRRRELAQHYDRLLADVAGCQPIGESDTACSSYYLYVVRVDHRDAVRDALAREGIGTQIHYPIPVHRQEAFAGMGRCAGDMKVTDRLVDGILSLPLYPELEDWAVQATVDGIRQGLR
jgi:dTDP-4-amino-4,6-dideoxygalactose transaminase